MASRRLFLNGFRQQQQQAQSLFRRSASTSAREASGFQSLYNVFFRTNSAYVTYVVVGAIAFEVVYGKVTDFVWEQSNRGRLYHHVDWSRFKMEDEEEEEEEEDE